MAVLAVFLAVAVLWHLIWISWGQAGPSLGDVRLVKLHDSDPDYEGRLEIYFGHEFGHFSWGTICADSFRHDGAVTACNQLGYRGSSVQIHSEPSSDLQWLYDVKCPDSPLHILRCSYCIYGVRHWPPRCMMQPKCELGDVLLNCGSDHIWDPEFAYEGQVRLCPMPDAVDTYPSRGIVQVFHKWNVGSGGQWGSVNSPTTSSQLFFGYYEANAVCLQLGYSGYSNYAKVNVTDKCIWNVSAILLNTSRVNCKTNFLPCFSCCYSVDAIDSCYHCDPRNNILVQCKFDAYLPRSELHNSGNATACAIPSEGGEPICGHSGGSTANSPESVPNAKVDLALSLGIFSTVVWILSVGIAVCCCIRFRRPVMQYCIHGYNPVQ